MPYLERDGLKLHYEEFGSGYPLVLFAPGGMRSSIDFWQESPGTSRPWIDPTSDLAAEFRVVAMDQRNAGESTAAISSDDSWSTYTADHLALIDDLGIERTHILGGCIGSSYCLGLIEAAPERVSAAVLQNPIGLSEDNRPSFIGMFDDWAKALDGADRAALEAFRDNMFGGDFVFSVDRDFVRRCPAPLLVLSGHDQFHPPAVAEEIAALAPDAELVKDWSNKPETLERVRAFLRQHTPT